MDAMRSVSSLIRPRLLHIIGPLVIEQRGGILCIVANGGQRLIEFMTDAGTHGAQRRQLAGLHQLIRARTSSCCLLALQYFLFEAMVELFQIQSTPWTRCSSSARAWASSAIRSR